MKNRKNIQRVKYYRNKTLYMSKKCAYLVLNVYRTQISPEAESAGTTSRKYIMISKLGKLAVILGFYIKII